MSVVDPRLAAAQRTAASHGAKRAGHRVRLLATWLFIVPLLSLFSFSVVASAKTLSKPDLKGAVSRLPSNEHVIQIAVGSGDRDHGNKDKGKGGGGDGSDTKNLIERFNHAEHFVCSVTGSQLVRIKKRYRTSRFSLDVRGRSLDIVAVYDASERELRGYLGGAGVTCELVSVSRVFFLPFDAHTS
jgi:hypothetical protein